MAVNDFYIVEMNTEDQATDPLDLIERWRREPGRSQLVAIREALEKEGDIPASTPMLDCVTEDGPIQLADLRGIDFKGWHLDAYDLSYCCLDYALFLGTSFQKTRLQYSSFKNAIFDGAIWNGVQASPIYAKGASFRFAEIAHSVLMHCDFGATDFTMCRLSNATLVASNLGSAFLSQAILGNNVDIRTAIFTETDDIDSLQNDYNDSQTSVITQDFKESYDGLEITKQLFIEESELFLNRWNLLLKGVNRLKSNKILDSKTLGFASKKTKEPPSEHFPKEVALIASDSGDRKGLYVQVSQGPSLNINEPWEVAFWANHFGVSEDQLRAVIKRVGKDEIKVLEYVKTL